MTSWGENPFENDAAVEYAREVTLLEDGDVETSLHTSMEDLVSTGENTLTQWQVGVAAAAIIACQLDDNLGMDSPAAAWLEDEPIEVSDDLRELAKETLTAALNEGPLHDGWVAGGVLGEAEDELETYLNALS